MEEECWRQRRRWRINNMRRRGVGVTVKEFIPWTPLSKVRPQQRVSFAHLSLSPHNLLT